MTNLTILETSIRSNENLYSLNDLHRASGSEDKHRPALFMRNQQTLDLIDEINLQNSQSANSISGKTPNLVASKIVRGGKDLTVRGYWVCEELVLSYAMWISPKFHLIVLRAFLAMHRNQAQQLELSKTKGKKQRGLLPPKNPFGYMTYEREFTAHELEWLVLSWYQAYEYRELLKQLFPMLEAAQSALLTPIKNRIASSDMDFKLSADVLFRITRGTDVMRIVPLITLENYAQ